MPEVSICRERILSEDYWDFIVGRSGTYWREEENGSLCRLPLEYSFQILYPARERVAQDALYEFPYYAIPKCYTLLDMQALEQTGIARVQNFPTLELNGEGVMIGFVDTGINYRDPVFRNLDGTTRIISIWDQSIQTGTAPERLIYGSEYSREQINEALQADNPESVVPSMDVNGHGTFVASIACGSGNAENLFLGAAPEADIVVVKLKEAKQYLRDFYYIDSDAVCYQENDIMSALFYLHQVMLREKKPMVVCMALGTSMGGHSGEASLPAYMQLLGNVPYMSLVAGTGNEADKRHHFQGRIEDTQGEMVEISVGNNTRGFTLELWTNIPNIFSVSITSPAGDSSGAIPVRKGAEMYDFILEQTRVFLNYRLLVESTNSELIFMQFDRPTSGIWKIDVKPIQLEDGVFHAWLPMEEFLTGTVFFLRSNPEYTITAPGNTQSVACVSYYNGADNSIAVSSGRGYTRINENKPDIAAPGVNVTGVNLRGQFTARTGSSIATALTAGAEVLLMEWLDRRGEVADSVQIKNLLILGAERSESRIYPNREWGYGALNLYQTFEAIRRL